MQSISPQGISGIGLLEGRIGARGHLDPAFGQKAFAVPDTVIEIEQAKAGIIHRPGIETAIAQRDTVLAHNVLVPVGIAFHAQRCPYLFLNDLMKRLIIDAAQNSRQHMAGRGDVVEFRSGVRHALELQQGLVDIAAPDKGIREQNADIRVGIIIILHEIDTRRHHQQMPKGCLAKRRSFELRCKFPGQLIEAVDPAFLQGHGDQRGNKTLGDGPGGRPTHLVRPIEILLVHNDPVVHDDQTQRTGEFKILAQRPRFAVEFVGHIQRACFARQGIGISGLEIRIREVARHVQRDIDNILRLEGRLHSGGRIIRPGPEKPAGRNRDQRHNQQQYAAQNSQNHSGIISPLLTRIRHMTCRCRCIRMLACCAFATDKSIEV